MTDIRIREASETDIPTMQDIADRSYLVAYRGIHSEEQNLYMKNMMYSTESLLEQMRTGSRFFLVYANETATGYCAIKPVAGEPDVIYIDKLYVLPDMKFKGFGKALIERVLEEAGKRDNISIIRLDVNRSNPSIAFYKSFGFTTKREWDAPIGNGYEMNAVTMEKSLRN